MKPTEERSQTFVAVLVRLMKPLLQPEAFQKEISITKLFQTVRDHHYYNGLCARCILTWKYKEKRFISEALQVMQGSQYQKGS